MSRSPDVVVSEHALILLQTAAIDLVDLLDETYGKGFDASHIPLVRAIERLRSFVLALEGERLADMSIDGITESLEREGRHAKQRATAERRDMAQAPEPAEGRETVPDFRLPGGDEVAEPDVHAPLGAAAESDESDVVGAGPAAVDGRADIPDPAGDRDREREGAGDPPEPGLVGKLRFGTEAADFLETADFLQVGLITDPPPFGDAIDAPELVIPLPRRDNDQTLVLCPYCKTGWTDLHAHFDTCEKRIEQRRKEHTCSHCGEWFEYVRVHESTCPQRTTTPHVHRWKLDAPKGELVHEKCDCGAERDSPADPGHGSDSIQARRVEAKKHTWKCDCGYATAGGPAINAHKAKCDVYQNAEAQRRLVSAS